MTSIPQVPPLPSEGDTAHPLVTASLVQIDDKPHVRIAFSTLRDGEIPALSIADAERFAFYVLNLVLDTKKPNDLLPDRKRAHLGSPPLDPEATREDRSPC